MQPAPMAGPYVPLRVHAIQPSRRRCRDRCHHDTPPPVSFSLTEQLEKLTVWPETGNPVTESKSHGNSWLTAEPSGHVGDVLPHALRLADAQTVMMR